MAEVQVRIIDDAKTAGPDEAKVADTPETGGDQTGSTVTDAELKKFNQIGFVLHSVQGILMLVASQAVSSIKDFSKDITRSYIEFDETTNRLVAATTRVSGYEVGATAGVFLLLSAAAHGLVLLKWDMYLRDLGKGINRMRWYEYAISSSVMIMSIAVLFGCYDLGSLLLIFMLNATMNLFGLLMERMNPPGTKDFNWEPFLFGCFSGLGPWVVVFIYFLGSNPADIPGFVYGILFSYLIFFNTFPVNMTLQYLQWGKWSDYRYGEKVYIVLSLFSKSLLAWLVFGGTFQPN